MTECEKKYEAIILDLGLTAPRITPAMINELMDRVTYATQVVPGTATTLATAIAASGFTLCTVESACASPENFNPALGIEIAITKARAAAREKLWELEGYRLTQALYEVRQDSGTQALEQIRTVLGRGAVVMSAPTPSLWIGRVRNLSRSLAATADDLCAGKSNAQGLAIADAAIKAVEAAGGYGRARAQAAGTCPLWRSCKPSDGVCTCQAGKACT